MSTVYAHYEHVKDTRFKVHDGYNGLVVLNAESLDGGLDVSLFMQPDQLRMLVSAAAEYLTEKEENDANNNDS